MHIALWSPAWPLAKFQNGIVTYVHWMRLELERQGHRVSVFTEVLSSSDEERGVYGVGRGRWDRMVRRLLRRRVEFERDVFDFSTVIAPKILEVHRRNSIDIIEMEESFGWFAEVEQLTSLPVLVKLHGPAFLSMVAEERLSLFGRRKIEREGRALARATTIVSPSAVTLAQTIGRYGLSPQGSGIIVNPLEMDHDTPVWRLDACERDTILFVGRFDLRKGGDIVLQAFMALLRERPHLKLIFVGPDRGLPTPDGKQIHFDSYCDGLFSAQWRNRIEFRGPMANREIAKLRARSMITVAASRWENQGYTVLEAMFQGCPVVSTDAGGCRESVIDGVTGRLARSEDPADLAAKLAAMLADPEGAVTLGRAARRHVLEQHAPDKVAAASLDMYRKRIALHARHRSVSLQPQMQPLSRKI